MPRPPMVACPKPVRVTAPDHLAYVRTLPCLVEGLHADDPCDGFSVRDVPGFGPFGWRVATEAAHVRGKGAGGGDEQVIPLCGKHHRWDKHSLHRLNVKGFDKHWGTHVRRTARALYRERRP